MAEPTNPTEIDNLPTDTNFQNPTDVPQNLPTETDNNPPITVTYTDIKATFTRYFSEFSQTTKPLDASERLLKLLMEQININHVKSHETQIQKDNLPGNATPLTNQSSEGSSIEPEKSSPKDKKDKLQQELKELKESKDKLKNEIKISKKKQQEDEIEIKNLKKKRQEDENEINYLKKKRQDDENEKNQLMNDLVNQIEREKHEKSKLNQECDRLGEQLKNKRKEYADLYKKNEELRQEASEYQSALGDAKNYRLSDDDANNPTQLTKEIEIIQDKLNDFCKLKGTGIEINEPKLVELLKSFNCTYESGDKVLLKAALQRHIVEVIIYRTKEYFDQRLQHNDKITGPYHELYVYNSTDEYLSKLNKFIDSRNGTDEVSFAAPKKIRKLVYAVFGDRGFGISNDKKEHEFVQVLKAEIIDRMDKYRTIKKADKKKDNEDMIAGIIRNVIKMFNFRIKVLEPPGEIDWIEKGSKIDPTTMEVGNLEDDNHDDLVVNLCSFPLIGVNLKSTTDRKVLVPAKITTIKVESKGFMNNFMPKKFRSQTETNEQPPKRKHSSHSSDTQNKNIQPRNSSDPKITKPPTPPQKF